MLRYVASEGEAYQNGTDVRAMWAQPANDAGTSSRDVMKPRVGCYHELEW